MNFTDVEAAFCEELQKIGASNMHIAQSRSGRRPISATNLLKKDSEGKLFKNSPKPAIDPEKTAASGGSIRLEPAEQVNTAYTAGPLTGAEARFKRKKGEPPSREDVDTRDVYDQRNNMAIIPGTGTQSTDVGVS